jgi:hypothetical protein
MKKPHVLKVVFLSDFGFETEQIDEIAYKLDLTWGDAEHVLARYTDFMMAVSELGYDVDTTVVGYEEQLDYEDLYIAF